MQPPKYFERIRDGASKRWDQLEGDPELAGPWLQLFAQVQSPRHVVSELLQNADDAGATDASVEIRSGEFVFSHNGEDFSEEQFASLCQFGFSNKRMLHTIGFRGMGFKSIFSLGEEVHLVTPTLSVAFRKQRFTRPVWTESPGTLDGRTKVRVAIQKQQVQQELADNLERWGENPASLLFFNNIRCLQINEREIRWESKGAGPVRESEWMSSTSDTSDNQYLIIRSPEEEFPEDALREIREERMTPNDDAVLPPCRVEIVLGMEGRLFTVLPTNVTTELPFACNAPFVQDPARYGIKDPALSPTNGWLLKRVGLLAAEAMLTWVGRESLPAKERCRAYGLLPDTSREDEGTIGEDSGAIVKEIFEGEIEGAEFLLTETGALEANECLGVPDRLLDVWSPSQVFEGFSLDGLPILSRHVSKRDREKLASSGHVSILVKSQVIEILESKSLPRPESWWQLLRLWDYVSDEVITGVWYDRRSMCIVPVRGEEMLCAASEVVRSGERRILKPADYEFLAPYLLTLDLDWIHFLSQQAQTAETDGDKALEGQVSSASKCVSALGLAEPTNVNHIMKNAADNFFSCDSSHTIRDCVRLTHIAAKLGAVVPDNFKFMTQSLQLIPGPILADIDNDLDTFVDVNWRKKNVLHGDYCAVPSETCSADEWRQWVRSPDSHLHTFVPLSQTTKSIQGRPSLVEDLSRRGFDGKPRFYYKKNSFEITDWDFDPAHWKRWTLLAENDDRFWATLMTRILEQPSQYWSEKTSARASQPGYTRSHYVTQEQLLPDWIIRFRDLSCLPDTRGQSRQPAEIFRRTPETEPLQDIEPFIRANLDTEKTKPLLKLLGIRDKPTSPKPILDRLRALAAARPTLLPEVQRWCHSLDQLFDRCSTPEIQEVKTAFADERLILTDQDKWASTDEVFLDSGVDCAPGAVLIHHSLRDISLWRKIGVLEYPTADMEIGWLKGLPSNGKLDSTQIGRIRRAMQAYPDRVWNETRHWLNLEGDWVPTNNLVYSVTPMQPLLSWRHLFPAVKGKTADFGSLSSETYQGHPFSALPALSESIEERFQEQADLPSPREKPWLGALGAGLQRIVLDDPDQMERVRGLARRLSTTRWQVAEGLRSEPYIGGTPAGIPRPIDVLWHADLLYVQKGSAAKMARLVPPEIAKAFDLPDVTEAIKLCYERSPAFVQEYLEDNFDLAPHITEDESYRLDTQEAQSDTMEGQGPVVNPLQDEQLLDEVQSEEVTPQSGDANGAGEPPVLRSPRPTRPTRLGLIERFAQVRGFAANGTGIFEHKDGRSLERTPGNAFPWGLRSAQGDILQYYWFKEHCIQKEPLQLDVSVWELCQQYPELYSLVLTDANDAPVCIPGSELVQMREQDRLVLYPATYMLEYRGEDSR